MKARPSTSLVSPAQSAGLLDPHQRKTISTVLIIVMVAMLVLSLMSFWQYHYQLQKTLAEKNRQDMKRYTGQSTLLINSILQDYFHEMDSIALFCQLGTGVYDEEIINLLKKNNDGNQYTQVGICGTDGLLYTGVGHTKNISGMDYFQRALRGEAVVTQVLPDSFHGRDAIVLARPILADGRPVGIISAVYDVVQFTQLLGNPQNAGFGTTLIIQQDGQMVSRYEGLGEHDSFFAMLSDMELGNDTLADIKAKIGSGESGYFTFYQDDKPRFVYYEPTGISDWVTMSVMLSESQDKQYSSISHQAILLMLKNVLFYSVILVCIWLVLRRSRLLFQDNQKDILTGLYNKMTTRIMMEKVFRREGRTALHACFFIDIDNFKQINDTQGHAVGDQLLMNFGQCLRYKFRETDIISRFGGDEFVIWIKNIPSRATAEQKARELCAEISNNPSFPTSISVGISCYPLDGTTYDQLLHQADEALYRAKKQGKNRYQFFHEMMD